MQNRYTAGVSQTLGSFALHLAAEGRSPKTIRTYSDAAAKLARECDIWGFDLADRAMIEKHIVSLLERYSPGYVNNQFRALQQLFRWFSEEEELPNPMAGMKVPAAEPKAVPVFTEGEIEALLKACSGRGWRARRDVALISLFRDTGCRLAELAGLAQGDLDLHNRECLVVGKGKRERWVKFSSKTALAIDRWLRVRPEKLSNDTTAFGMTANGIYQAIKRRGAQAGVPVHPHKFRHHFAHTWLDRGGAEGDLMQLAGWRSASMLRRYGASAASSRARRSYDRVMG